MNEYLTNSRENLKWAFFCCLFLTTFLITCQQKRHEDEVFVFSINNNQFIYRLNYRKLLQNHIRHRTCFYSNSSSYCSPFINLGRKLCQFYYNIYCNNSTCTYDSSWMNLNVATLYKTILLVTFLCDIEYSNKLMRLPIGCEYL
jgi:hypothetical protein